MTDKGREVKVCWEKKGLACFIPDLSASSLNCSAFQVQISHSVLCLKALNG